MLMSIVAVGLMASGCSSLGSLGGLIGLSQNKIEAILAAQVAGSYVVQITKDGEIVLAEAWECTKDAESGKLTGCHKR